MRNSRSNPPWEDLPQELLSTIANLLTSNSIDILTFRAICKSWYSSSPPPSPFNLSHMLPLVSCFPAPSFDIRFWPSAVKKITGLPMFSVTVIFALRRQQLSRNMELQDTKSWLMFVDQLTPSKLMIRQPLTKYHYSMPINFPSCVDVPNIHVDEIARFYNFSFHPAVNKPPSMWSEYVDKVLINSDESIATVLFQSGQVGSMKLTFHDIAYHTSWGPVYSFGCNDVDARIDDIAYHRGRIVGVDRVGRLLYVAGGNLIVSELNGCGTKRKRLVESNGVIYLVVRRESKGRIRFKVFELDEDVDEWVEVTSIGDLVFFFGLDFSFSVSPHKLGGSFRGNCIVYVENSFKDYDEGVVDDVMLFSNFRYGDLRIGVWHMDDPHHCGAIGSYPGYSNVLWPPPTWLWTIDMSKRIENLEAALDDLFRNAPVDKLKALANELPPLEQAICVNDNANQQDNSEIWRGAHTAQVYLNQAKDFHKHLEAMAMGSKNPVSKQHSCESIKFQNQHVSGSSSRGTDEEWQGSANFEASDEFISRETQLNGMLLHLEEITAKLQSILKSRQ